MTCGVRPVNYCTTPSARKGCDGCGTEGEAIDSNQDVAYALDAIRRGLQSQQTTVSRPSVLVEAGESPGACRTTTSLVDLLAARSDERRCLEDCRPRYRLPRGSGDLVLPSHSEL